jgi:alkanesulfonate monooxygenase SsuD/methylene tetrahydromethanopterin reductase-like flavin-dependent oxidoreductase (luciferase family)
MRLSVVTWMRPGDAPPGKSSTGVVDYARRIEAAGFSGVWTTDAIGRGFATLEPMAVLAAIAAATERVELGTAVMQVSMRNPVDLAHRAETVQALSGGRLRLGVGTGSTKSDFDLVGADYSRRFRDLMPALDLMRRAWRGEAINGAVLTPWPGCAGGPPVILGAWRNPRWIEYAATECEGWMASGLHSSWEDLERGMQVYRAAGGADAIIANVIVDPTGRPEPGSWGERARISLVCDDRDEARRRLRRLRQIGFDEVLLLSHRLRLDELEQVRDYL